MKTVIRDKLKVIAADLFGLILACIGIGLLMLEYKDGAAHAHVSLVFLYVAIFGLGCLIIAPTLITGAAQKLTVLVLDARKGGSRWSDPAADKPKEPVIEKPPAGAGDV